MRWLQRQTIALLLCIVTGLLTMVVLQQGRTIDSQRTLIRQLFKDSLELNAVKVRRVNEHNALQR